MTRDDTLEFKYFFAILHNPGLPRRELLETTRFAAGPLLGSYKKRCDALDNLFMLGLVDSKYARPKTRKAATV